MFYPASREATRKAEPLLPDAGFFLKATLKGVFIMFPVSKAISLQDHIQNMTWLSESERKKAGRLSDLIELERERLMTKYPERTEREFFGLLSTETTRVSIYKRKTWDFFINDPESFDIILKGFYPKFPLIAAVAYKFLEFVYTRLAVGNDAIFWHWQWSRTADEAARANVLIKHREFTQFEARRNGGKNSAKERQQDEVHRCWQDWQADRGMYKNQEAFILTMQTKLKVSRQSVFNWLKEWKTLQKSTNA